MAAPVVLLAAVGLSSVAIDLPADTPAQLVQQVVDSCNEALGAKRCEAAQAGRRNSALLAVVRFGDATVDIRLFRVAPVRTELERRSVAFSEDDARGDRYIAAGLMVAALTAAQPEPTPVPEPQAGPPAPPRPSPPPSPAEASNPTGLDAGFEIGQGLDSHHPKYGGSLRAWWIAHGPRLGVTGGASYLYAANRAELTWTSASLGIIGRATPWRSLVSVEVSAEGMFQRVVAAAELAGTRESASVGRGGGRFGSKVAFEFGRWVHPWLGWEMSLLRRGLKVTLEDERIGAEGALRFGMALGLRFVVSGH